MKFLETYKAEIIRLCQQYNVKSLYAFGSVLTNHFNKESDVDLMVNFNNIKLEDYADNYFDFKFALQDTLERSIDLLEENAISNPFFKQNFDKQKRLVYGC
jgi:predicted nucleotidyltransferase